MPLATPYDDGLFSLLASINTTDTVVSLSENSVVPAGATKIYAYLITKATYGDKGLGQIETKEPIEITNVGGTGDKDFTVTRGPSPLPFNKGDILHIRFRAQWIIDMNAAIGGTTLPGTHPDNTLIRTDGVDTGAYQISGILVDDSGNVTIPGTIKAGSAGHVITTGAGLVAHGKIDPAIAGAGLSVAAGVLSVDAHTIASHDTTATGAQLNTLVGGGDADALHTHPLPDWASPGTIGSGTPNTGDFTSITATDLEVIGAGSFGIAGTEGTLHVHTASAGAITANAVADDLVVENDGDAGISILCPDGSLAWLVMGSPGGGDGIDALITWRFAQLKMTVGTAISSAILILRSGNDADACTFDANQDMTIVGAFNRTPVTITTDTTPTAIGRGVIVIGAWTAGNDITDFDNETAGQELIIIGGDTDCNIVDGSGIELVGGTAWNAAVGATLRLYSDGTTWIELSRSAT